MPKKKVLLVVIDALATRVVEPALAAGKLPNLARLREQGKLIPRCTPAFPSITPAATTTIATGEYPARHGILGNFWYDEDEDEAVYLGDDFWVLINKGFGEFFRDYVEQLNYQPTACEVDFSTHGEKHGLETACINYLCIRGEVHHELNVPLLLQLLPGANFPDRESAAHKSSFWATLSVLASLVSDQTSEPPRIDDTIFSRYGFNDAASAKVSASRSRKLRNCPISRSPISPITTTPATNYGPATSVGNRRQS